MLADLSSHPMRCALLPFRLRGLALRFRARAWLRVPLVLVLAFRQALSLLPCLLVRVVRLRSLAGGLVLVSGFPPLGFVLRSRLVQLRFLVCAGRRSWQLGTLQIAQARSLVV